MMNEKEAPRWIRTARLYLLRAGSGSFMAAENGPSYTAEGRLL